jgi:hypothetical protein|nr:MAG TPA: hypothetical protein [Caudoviricetes sp.]
MSTSEKVQSYNVGKSDYAKHAIQPWQIWKEYNLNPWDADIVKRVLRTKEGEPRTLDYEKIIHICKYRIAELSKEALKENKVVTPAEAEKPVEDEESDDTTVFCLDETMNPAMFYTEGKKWNGKYVGYSVFMTGNEPYMYLGVDAEGNHLYADLSEFGQRLYTQEAHLPPKTFELNCTNLFGNHRSSLKIGFEGKNYKKHDYIVTAKGHLLRYFGMEGNKYLYRNMSTKRADGTYPEFLSSVKLENKAIQFTL